MSLSIWLLLAFTISCGGAALATPGETEQVPTSWGAMWHPQLPARERHPSLFYDESDRARMRERLEQDPWKRWLQEAGSSSRTTPALRWWVLGDEQAAREARDDLLTRPITRVPGQNQPEAYLEPSSHPFADYVAAYDLLAAWPGLSLEDQAVIRERIAAEADYYYQVLGGVHGGSNYGNQRTLGASALGMAALALCEYRHSPIGPARWLSRALYEIRREENFWLFRPGGLFVEGAVYTSYMNAQFVPFAIAYERATGKCLFADSRLREWLIFAAYQIMANGEVIPWGTCEADRGLWSSAFFALLSNQRYGRDLAPLFHRAFTLPALPSPHPLHAHIALALYDPDIRGKVPEASQSFAASQSVVLRANWGHDTVAAWFAGKEAPWPLPYRHDTYSHGDSGHFVLAAWDEVLAADSGYNHWVSDDYYDAPFHNVILIDGAGPQRDTPGIVSEVEVHGPVRHAAVTTSYRGCTVRRTLALVRDRYVVIADRITANAEHDYTWQVRSACPPGSPGSRLSAREATWPGLSATDWRELKPGRAQLTTVVPPFAHLSLERGRWRPMYDKPEFINQVATATWRGADSAALFVLIPNLQVKPEVSWRPLEGQGVEVTGPSWRDRISLPEAHLLITGSDGLQTRLPL